MCVTLFNARKTNFERKRKERKSDIFFFFFFGVKLIKKERFS